MRPTRKQRKRRDDSGMKPIKVALLCLISFLVGANFGIPSLDLDCSPLEPSTPLNSPQLPSTPISEKEPRTITVDKHSNRRSKNLLQIGANDGVTGNIDFVQALLNDTESKAILVEGSPQIYRLLVQNVKTLYDETLKRIVPINAMVCEDGKQMTFYSPDIDKMKEKTTRQNLTIPHWVEYQIGSLEEKSVLKGLRGWMHYKVNGAFPRGLSAKDFVRQESIDCISLASIIAQSSVTADEIGVLAIDVEGFDAPVMLESLKVPGLEPDKIVFEHKSTTTFFPEEFNTVMETLEARGYKLDCHRDSKATGGWRCGGGQDVHAVKEVSLE